MSGFRVSLVAVCLLQAILVLSTQQTKAASVHASASPAVPMRPWQGRVARREVEGIGSFLREAPGPYEPEASLQCPMCHMEIGSQGDMLTPAMNLHQGILMNRNDEPATKPYQPS